MDHTDDKVCIIKEFCLVNVVRTDSKLVRYVSLVWQVRL